MMMLELECVVIICIGRHAHLLVQDAQARQGFALEQVSRAATQAGEAAMAMPGDNRPQAGCSLGVQQTCTAQCLHTSAKSWCCAASAV